MALHEVFVCPPRYASLDYAINPWMDPTRPFHRDVACRQWEALVDVYRDLGLAVREVPPAEGLPELCFVGDSVFLLDRTALFGRFRYPERAPEAPHVKGWLLAQGIGGAEVPDDVIFEGAGETLFWRDRILFGFGKRSTENARHYLRQVFRKDTIDFELERDDFYHLDTALLPIADDLLAYFPAAFGPIDTATLESFRCEKIHVSPEEARAFACNAIVVGRTVIGSVGAPRLWGELRRRAYEVIEVDISEFLKLGGGIKCLTLQHHASASPPPTGGR